MLQNRDDHEESDGVPERDVLVHVREEEEVGRCQAVPNEVERDGERGGQQEADDPADDGDCIDQGKDSC